jgi:hypothetical protein
MVVRVMIRSISFRAPVSRFVNEKPAALQMGSRVGGLLIADCEAAATFSNQQSAISNQQSF